MARMSFKSFVSAIEALPAEFEHRTKGEGNVHGLIWFRHPDVPYCKGKIGVCAIEAVALDANLKYNDGNPVAIRHNYEDCGVRLGLAPKIAGKIVNVADAGDSTLDKDAGYSPSEKVMYKKLSAALDRRAKRLARAAKRRSARGSK